MAAGVGGGGGGGVGSGSDRGGITLARRLAFLDRGLLQLTSRPDVPASVLEERTPTQSSSELQPALTSPMHRGTAREWDLRPQLAVRPHTWKHCRHVAAAATANGPPHLVHVPGELDITCRSGCKCQPQKEADAMFFNQKIMQPGMRNAAAQA